VLICICAKFGSPSFKIATYKVRHNCLEELFALQRRREKIISNVEQKSYKSYKSFLHRNISLFLIKDRLIRDVYIFWMLDLGFLTYRVALTMCDRLYFIHSWKERGFLSLCINICRLACFCSQQLDRLSDLVTCVRILFCFLHKPNMLVCVCRERNGYPFWFPYEFIFTTRALSFSIAYQTVTKFTFTCT